jgi:hypothetical protein
VKRDIQYALDFASKHCSPRTCNSCAETPWISPSFSATASPGLNFGIEVVDMVKGEERGKEETRRRGAFGDDDARPRLERGADKERVGQLRWISRDTYTTTLFVS